MAKIRYLRDAGEEFLNSLTHAVTLGIALMCTYMLVAAAKQSGQSTWPFYLFGGVMCGTFLSSVLYHGTIDPVLKSRFRTLDLISIFIAIAGGFISLFRIMLPTPEFILYSTLSVLITCVCIFVKFKIFNNSDNFWPSLGVYLVVAWSNVIFLLDAECTACPEAAGLVLSGGIVYTLGSAFYLFDFRRYFHTIWHLCASCGFILHVSALMKMT